ncbi:ElaB/YqjD/DUF883 family membrane-anchored ribosome-binding protein [Sphingomonas vulcanisoli]|uniref:ElaB/YqjD/DUF883 family membrane-anchored ribosome-binding protein n=1 Tax=Sphingomonas vulcanisoli TaxID=1658060 RepID=A0ABX0TPZ9_9SPHN|nr:hypothetical protein [Sphingomonas vulcanisoli]NIJ06839.1 ElaB/YqjD/DUF883 family membrane-anchored ribosome-binding protein [Sphingomonas vulcanisoli]
MADTDLPEGTDHVINGAGVSGDDIKSDFGNGGSGGNAAFFDKIEGWRTQGYDKARDYAVQGKERATGALDELLALINDAAAQVDDKIGSQYGDYARRASSGIETFNEALKGKDVDELFTEARDLVAKAPAVAVGTAAVLGFIIARLAKAGMDSANKLADAKPTKPTSDA